MISNHHYYTKRQVGLNPDPYRDVLTFLLNITYDNNKDVVQLQSFRTDDGIHPDTEYRVPINATWTKPASGAPLFPQFSIPANIIQTATGITVGDYPTSQSANTGLTFQTFESTSTPGLQPSYKKLYYKPNNPQFGQQGAVSSGDVITRKRYNTITNAASSYRNALVYKGDSTNPEEEITLCTWCFQDMEEYFKDNDYNCDDWDLENESDNN